MDTPWQSYWMAPGIHTIIAALLSCYYLAVGSAEDAAALLMKAEETASSMPFSTMSANETRSKGNDRTNDTTLIEAFPAHIKTSFFISAATTLCILLSCSFLIGLYEVHDRKKQKPVKTHA
ncbi:hypothetical protein Aduo_017341 [Ancylostoma duodenale]